MKNKEDGVIIDPRSINIIQATLSDYPTIQNMARFYVYDISRECGFISEEWACPKDGLYESFDFKDYFQDPMCKAFLIKVGEEIAGFVLLNKVGTVPTIDWNMGQFFILAKFQGKGIGQIVAHQIWELHPGLWEIAVIPENKSALAFWRQAVSRFTNGVYNEEIKTIDYDPDQPNRYILSFDTTSLPIQKSNEAITIHHATTDDIEDMVALSYQKRLAYSKVQSRFWCHAKEAERSQAQWFKRLLEKEDYILLVARTKNKIKGFIIGRLTSAPEVYAPGGLTLMIDDFCVESPLNWIDIGRKLLTKIKEVAQTKGAVQIVVVTGHHDEPKRHLLSSYGLSIVSEWYVGECS